MKKLLLLFSFIVSVCTAAAQNLSDKTVIDFINQSPDYKQQKKMLDSFFRQAMQVDAQIARNAFEKLVEKVDNKKLPIKYDIFNFHSTLLENGGLIKEQINTTTNALKIAEQLKDSVKIINQSAALASSYFAIFKPDIGLVYLNKVKNIIELAPYKDHAWKIYLKQAQYEHVMNNKEKSIDYLENAYYAIKESPTQKMQYGFVLFTIVENLRILKAHEKLAHYSELYLEYISKKQTKTPFNHISIFSLKNTKPSIELEKNIFEVINHAAKNKYDRTLVYATLTLADFYDMQKLTHKAIPYLQLCTKIDSFEHKSDLAMNVYYKLTKYYENNNDFKAAFTYNKKYKELKDSVQSNELKVKVKDLELKYGKAEDEKKITAQTVTIAKKDKQKNSLLVALLGLATLSAIGYLIFRKKVAYQKTIAKQQLQIQQNDIEQLQQKNKLLSMNSMLDGQEAERMRIAKDLHDGLGGLLSTVKAQFSTLQHEIESLEKFNIYQKANALIDEACSEVRRISHNMVPTSISVSGIKGAIEDLAGQLQLQNLHCNLELVDVPTNLSENKQLMIYRIIQELTFNVVKHANATEVFIQIFKNKPNSLHITIEDNGIGFDVDAALAQKGIGLKSINSRVDYLNGSIMYDSVLGKGTTVNIEIPLHD